MTVQVDVTVVSNEDVLVLEDDEVVLEDEWFLFRESTSTDLRP